MSWSRLMSRMTCALFVAGMIGCGARSIPSANGTKRMADTLAALYARAVAEPTRYEFLNRERVDAMQLSIFQQAGQPAMSDRYRLARELLLAGRTREAITALEALRLTAGMYPDARAPQYKPFFDLLGIAYLRLGEQENCNLNPNTSVCILGALRHTQEEGARQAIDIYTRILQAFPDDIGSRWLLNIAYMATGGYPSHVPKHYLRSEEHTSELQSH